MQYILSQEEYSDLTAKRNLEIEMQEDKLQALCTKIANEMPILFWGHTEARPWLCYMTEEEEHYCDECPVQEICPSHKHWSQ